MTVQVVPSHFEPQGPRVLFGEGRTQEFQDLCFWGEFLMEQPTLTENLLYDRRWARTSYALSH